MERFCSALVLEEKTRFPAGVPWKFGYGTAGFRDRADRLDRVLFRMGVLACLRSKTVKAAVGVAITASHNPIEDNGVKIVEPLGEMLVQDWEEHATRLANAETSELEAVVGDIVESSQCDITVPAHVVLARDTRPSGKLLASHFSKAAELLNCQVTDYGVLTTPQLHYMVRSINTQGAFGEPSEDGYYKKLVTAFNQLLPKPLPATLSSSLKLDGANGVGAEKMKQLMQCFDAVATESGHASVLSVQVINDGSSGVLNKDCGADYVKTGQKPPQGMTMSVGEKCVSFDGDADRIVYFYKNSEERFRLLDGDKIAALAAGFICERLRLMDSDLSIGVVQTAYANGSSTSYLKDVLATFESVLSSGEANVPVPCTSTGVKHLHHKAMEFDVGIYFEANGHGTVLFSNRAIESFRMASEDQKLSNTAQQAAKQLLALTELINQAVGDSISDLLMVEAILLQRGWGCAEWDSLYRELPCRQLKVKVQDRMCIKTTDYARVCVEPVGLQGEIDQLVREMPQGRAFVRPSGTEDVVRVYAEAATQDNADDLAVRVGGKVYEMAGGIGEPPTL